MAINIKFDLVGNPEPPSIILANRNGNKLGQLNVNTESIDVSDKFNDASELSFTLNKYVDGELTPLWDKVVDFKLVYCPEWDTWFEITVELDEATETVKTVFCTQLGQAELSQIMLYNIEINTEADIERDDYKTSILYDIDNPKFSILHRLLEKAPHYSIAHVDESIQRIQRQFSFDGNSICDAFNEIAEEIGCLFVYNSNSKFGGAPNRTISVYDLQQTCNNSNCKHRGEFTDKCPKCGGTDITYGYGEDTTIFVTSDELATEGIQLVTDTDSVKNCFKLEAGDDLMTATIRNCNPNGTDYIWYFSNSIKEDMSDELVNKLDSYDALYKEYYDNHVSELEGSLVDQYNTLVNEYKNYYDTPSTCLDCKTEGDFEEQCSNLECGSKNILTGQKLQTIPTTITGYSALMTAYYNTIDLLLYLESGLMPNIKMSDTTAEEQLRLLTTASLSPVAVNVKDITNASLATANSAVLSMAKVLIRPTYKVEIKEDSSSLSELLSDDNGQYKTWTGKFMVTNYSDEKDVATHSDDEASISVRVNNDTETFIKQKIEKSLNKENTDDYSITGLFSKEYDEFCAELKKYALNPLDNFSKACDACLSILHEQGAGDENEKPDLYEKLYKPYFDKSQAINNEIAIRQGEIAIIEGVYDVADDGTKTLRTNGLQTHIERCQKEIQDALDFERFLGEDLWLEFCSYRREDKYSNDNYISDGLNNAELFKKANEFIEVAENEIFKSAELQHSISATLNNLLSLPKFKSLLKFFKTGNWIRVQVDDKVYKLRFLEYSFSYGDSESISVEFSDVTKIKNGTTDVQDILSQASSMASSYDSIQRQAEKGSVARNTIDQWFADGLNSANIQIANNDNEEVLITKSGLLARSYDDITGTYSPEQFKLTHNIMAYTTDNWETVSSALGKHSYQYWNGENFVNSIDYGLTSKFVQAGYVTGSQIIGGEIVSSNYNPKQRGTYINLLSGDFDFAGGKIIYDAENNEVKLKGLTIQWTGDDKVNAPTIENISGLDEYLVQIDQLEDQLDGRAETWYQSNDPSIEWLTDDTKNLHIGDLWHYTGETCEVNNVHRIKNSEWVWQKVNNDYMWVEIEISDSVFDVIDGKAQIFTSTPTPPYYVGDLWVQGTSGDIKHCVTSKTEGESYNTDDWIKSSKYTDDTALINFISNEYADDLVDIGNQVDGKARSWYQSTDPSINWDTNEDHEGDLWYNSSSDSQNTYIYDNGAWKQTSVPKALFDTIDGIASIYVTIPENPVVGDLLIPASDIDIYKAGKVYRYNGEIWSEINYTDDTVAQQALESARQGINDAANAFTLAQTANNNAQNAEINAKNYADSQDALLSNTLTNAYQTYTNSQVSTLDTAVGNYLGLGGSTMAGSDFLISPYIAGGYLNITGTENNLRVLIDPNNLTNNGYVFQVHNSGYENEDGSFGKIVMGVDGNGDAVFNGTVYASAGEFTGTISGSEIIAGSNFSVTSDGVMTATSGYIGGWTISENGLSCTVGDTDPYTILLGSNSGHEYTVCGKSLANLIFMAGDRFGVTRNGTLYADYADISGKITATSGYIGTEESGFKIDATSISNGTLGSNGSICLSTTDMSGVSGFFDGDDINNWRMTVGSGFGVTSDGTLHAKNADISGKITATSGYIGDSSLGGTKWIIGSDSTNSYLCSFTDRVANSGGYGMDRAACYFGTNGLSYSCDTTLGYTTVIRPGNIINYGTMYINGTNYKATRLYQNGIDFFYTGSNWPYYIESLYNYKVGSIEVDNSSRINISTNNALTINGNETLSGWMEICVPGSEYVLGDTTILLYLHFEHGLLVETTTSRPSNVTWIYTKP